MESVVKFLFGGVTAGFIDFIWLLRRKLPFRKKRADWFGGPFNGQEFRRKIFLELVEKFDFESVYETGTYRGTTTEYMSKNSSANIWTSEFVDENYGYCKARFLFNNKVHLFLGDSRKFLREQYQLGIDKEGFVFFYLDAHWNDDLPLLEECQVIFENNNKAIIMIDDFQVKGDDGYKYDDYGNGKALTLEYLDPIRKYEVASFFPNCPSENETKSKRGCVVLGNTQEVNDALRKIKTLKEYTSWGKLMLE